MATGAQVPPHQLVYLPPLLCALDTRLLLISLNFSSMRWGQASFFTGLLGGLDKLISPQTPVHTRLRERPQLVVMVMRIGRILTGKIRGTAFQAEDPREQRLRGRTV